MLKSDNYQILRKRHLSGVFLKRPEFLSMVFETKELLTAYNYWMVTELSSHHSQI